MRSPAAIATLLMTAVALAQTAKKTANKSANMSVNKVPLGLLPIPWPADNPYSPDKVELGRLLYFDKRLSADNSVACATCHVPEKGFTDGAPFSTGIRGQRGGRRAPTVINRAYSLAQFWDGRAPRLSPAVPEGFRLS